MLVLLLHIIGWGWLLDVGSRWLVLVFVVGCRWLLLLVVVGCCWLLLLVVVVAVVVGLTQLGAILGPT